MQPAAVLQVWSLSAAQTLIGAAAILAFAFSGLLEAARKKLDIVGVCTAVGLAGFGAGTLRHRRPYFRVEHSSWLRVLLGLGLLAMLFMRARHFEPRGVPFSGPTRSAWGCSPPAAPRSRKTRSPDRPVQKRLPFAPVSVSFVQRMKPARHLTALRTQQRLADAGPDACVVEFERPTRTSAEAAAAIGCRVVEIAKSVVFRGKHSGQAVGELSSSLVYEIHSA